MKISRLIILGLMVMVLAIGLSGCKIISATPDPNQVVEMKLGDKVLFKVVGPVNTSTMYCEWSVKRLRGDSPVWFVDALEKQNEFEFEANSGGEPSNRIFIRCTVWHYGYYLYSGYPGYNTRLELGWHGEDVQEWEVRIHQDTDPIWQGAYYIRDSTDVKLLKGYTEITGDLIISNGPWWPVTGNIITLEDLNTLNMVRGNLLIERTSELTSLAGLQNLTAVGGSMCIRINNVLTSLGMASLQRVDGDFTISGNSLLCSSLAEELRNQVLADGGIGGTRNIEGNKECTGL